MKKIFYAILLLIVLISASAQDVQASVFLPKDVSIGGATLYEAGTQVTVDITPNEKRPLGLQKHLEYGVARTVDNEGLTFFEIITTEQKEITNSSDLSNLQVTIPNVLDSNATNTYVVYTKLSLIHI